MKKSLILPLLIVLSSCNLNASTTNSVESSSTTETSSSSTIEYAYSSSSSSSKVVSSTNEIHELNASELELVETEDKTGYLISKYRGTKYKNIRLPESYNNKPIVGLETGAMISASFENIYIPDCYTDFDPSAFLGCKVIKNYHVNDTHSLLKSVDGVLYTKDGNGLFIYPSGRRDNYKVVEGTKEILAYAFSEATVVGVTLPESIEAIGAHAFDQAKRLESVNIPSKVKVLKESAFDTCNSLLKVQFSEGLEEIEYRAFWQCYDLFKFELPSTLKIIGESAFEGLAGVDDLVLNEGLEYIGDFAFAYNEYIETISFPSTLKRIGKYAFMQNYMIKELNLNEGLEVLEEGAFFYNSNLRTVSIPSTLEEIGFDCFASSDSKLATFTVSEESESFKLQDGIIYSKDGKELVCCPSQLKFTNGTYAIPEGVEVIGDHAFYNNSSLRNVELPSTLKTIGKAPFYVCSISSLKYNGTMEEFQNVEKTIWEYNTGSYDENDNLVFINIEWNVTNYENGRAITKVICNDGTLDLTNN